MHSHTLKFWIGAGFVRRSKPGKPGCPRTQDVLGWPRRAWDCAAPCPLAATCCGHLRQRQPKSRMTAGHEPGTHRRNTQPRPRLPCTLHRQRARGCPRPHCVTLACASSTQLLFAAGRWVPIGSVAASGICCQVSCVTAQPQNVAHATTLAVSKMRGRFIAVGGRRCAELWGLPANSTQALLSVRSCPGLHVQATGCDQRSSPTRVPLCVARRGRPCARQLILDDACCSALLKLSEGCKRHVHAHPG